MDDEDYDHYRNQDNTKRFNEAALMLCNEQLKKAYHHMRLRALW